MAKQRFNLSETMMDARQGIEEARANAEKAGEESVLNQEKKETEAEHSQVTSTQTENTPEEITSQEPVHTPDQEALEPTEDDTVPEQESARDKAEKIDSPSVEKKINGIRKRMRKDDREERIMRNVYLDDDMLEKLEGIKKRMNRGRNKEKKDAFVSVIDLLNVAAQEFLDKYYTDIVGK